MKKIIKRLLIIATILIAMIWVKKAIADESVNYYAGVARSVNSNGVTALISTPQNPINLYSSGIANWVSTINSDANGRDWLQSGWQYYVGYSIPKQYVEWCINCLGEQGTYQIKDQFATQGWGTTVDYWVSRDTGSRWCAYTAGVVRYCVDNLHSTPVDVQVFSEVHNNLFNPIDATFNTVRYKNPGNNSWYLFDSQSWLYLDDFPPYNVEIYSYYYHFRTFRIAAKELFLPVLWR